MIGFRYMLGHCVLIAALVQSEGPWIAVALGIIGGALITAGLRALIRREIKNQKP